MTKSLYELINLALAPARMLSASFDLLPLKLSLLVFITLCVATYKVMGHSFRPKSNKDIVLLFVCAYCLAASLVSFFSYLTLFILR